MTEELADPPITSREWALLIGIVVICALFVFFVYGIGWLLGGMKGMFIAYVIMISSIWFAFSLSLRQT